MATRSATATLRRLPTPTTGTTLEGGRLKLRWEITWRSPGMSAPAFWGYSTKAEAMIDLRYFKKQGYEIGNA